MKQAEAFLSGEGDAWYARNEAKMLAQASEDPVMKVLNEQNVFPKSVLELGCSNGWRLDAMRERYGCKVVGVEPSEAACREANKRFPEVLVLPGTATTATFSFPYFDLIVFGFCLYLTDREDLFTIVANTDRWLLDGGYLAILDFDAPIPYSLPYSHAQGLKSYHMNHENLWLGNPAYSLARRYVLPDQTAVTLLRKKLDSWPERT